MTAYLNRHYPASRFISSHIAEADTVEAVLAGDYRAICGAHADPKKRWNATAQPLGRMCSICEQVRRKRERGG